MHTTLNSSPEATDHRPVKLPAWLDLVTLRYGTPQELIARADWHLSDQAPTAGWRRDLVSDTYDNFCFHHGPLGCVVPPRGAARPTEDSGLPLRLVVWALRKQYAKEALEAAARSWRTPPDAVIHAGPVAVDETENTCEHGGDHPAPEGNRFCSDACGNCDGAAFDAERNGCAGICGIDLTSDHKQEQP